jgi:hypothetical protein
MPPAGKGATSWYRAYYRQRRQGGGYIESGKGDKRLSPFIRVFIAALFCAMAVWFKRYRFERGEPARWFFLMLIAFALSLALSAISWWIRDDTISKSFWIACWVALSCSAFLLFGFARSFGSKADFTLLFWSIPLLFDIALIIIGNNVLMERVGSTWVPRAERNVYYLHWAINGAYAVLSVYYCIMAYLALKSHDQREETAHFRYVLAGLLVIIISQLAAGPLRAALNPGNPISEIGTLLGTVLLLIGVVEPKMEFIEKRRQGVA